MSRQRWLKHPPHPKGVLECGHRRCRWCAGPVEKPRRDWCSQKCVDDYMIRKSGSEVRRQVFARDKGVCAECGLDTTVLKRELKQLRRESYTRWRARYEELGLDRHRVSLYDADHIVPVEEGGGLCGLENYQTLCWKCHKQKTASQASNRKVRRKNVE